MAKAAAKKAQAPAGPMIHTPKARIDTTDVELNRDGERSFLADADLTEVSYPLLSEPDIHVVGARFSDDNAKELAFMEEKVILRIHGSPNEEHPVDPVPIWVNGKQILVWREQLTIVRRKYVERLARCKKTGYSCKKVKDNDGNDAYTYPQQTALMYPFTVERDDNPGGPAWLRRVLRET